jgi:hypothetical protein
LPRLYPLGRCAAAIARDLSSGRSTLYRYLDREQPARGIDDALLMLMARERIASQRRAREIARAEQAFALKMGRITVTIAAKDSK